MFSLYPDETVISPHVVERIAEAGASRP